MVLVLSVCMLFGGTVACYAADAGLDINGTKTKVLGKYRHEEYVGMLELDMYCYEKHSVTGNQTVKSVTERVTGGINSISGIGFADTDYYFTKVNGYAYADSNLVAYKNYRVI